MNFFKVYLPSNACTELYPNNTPSDYRTRFDKPIDLKGNWEVGVESIIYSPYIDDEDERAHINVSIQKQKLTTVNNMRWFHYVLRSDDTWPGFHGIEPDIYEEDSNDIDGVLRTLNMLGRKIITTEEQDFPIFHFRRSENDQVLYFPIDKSLTMLLTTELADVLGFSYEVVLGGAKVSVAKHNRKTGIHLTKANYHIKYFSSNVLEKVKRISLDPNVCRGLKNEDEFFTAFVRMWNLHVYPVVYMSCHFADKKLVLKNYGNHAIVLSPHLAESFGHPYPFFGVETERWAVNAAYLNSPPLSAMWYVDVFSNKMDVTVEMIPDNFTLNVYPWKFTSLQQVLRYLNSEVSHKTQIMAKTLYDETHHQIAFDMNLSEYCSLKIGKWIDMVQLSPNLSHLLGLPSRVTEKTMNAVREASIIKNRPRQLYLLSNMVQRTVVGKERLPILQDFLHRKSDNVHGVIEKRFNPISYIPIQKPWLDFIHLQLVDEHYQAVKIKDSKTLVTLYFQQIK